MQTMTINRNDWSGETITVRFNRPTDDGQDGRIVVGDQIFAITAPVVIEEGDGFTIRRVEVQQASEHPIRVTSIRFDGDDHEEWAVHGHDIGCLDVIFGGRDLIRAIVVAGCNVGLF